MAAATAARAARGRGRRGARGVAVVLAVGIDLLTKQLALTNLERRHAVRLLGGAVYLDLTRNSGAAFSIGTGFTWIFPLIAIVVIGCDRLAGPAAALGAVGDRAGAGRWAGRWAT